MLQLLRKDARSFSWRGRCSRWGCAWCSCCTFPAVVDDSRFYADIADELAAILRFRCHRIPARWCPRCRGCRGIRHSWLRFSPVFGWSNFRAVLFAFRWHRRSGHLLRHRRSAARRWLFPDSRGQSCLPAGRILCPFLANYSSAAFSPKRWKYFFTARGASTWLCAGLQRRAICNLAKVSTMATGTGNLDPVVGWQIGSLHFIAPGRRNPAGCHRRISDHAFTSRRYFADTSRVQPATNSLLRICTRHGCSASNASVDAS